MSGENLNALAATMSAVAALAALAVAWLGLKESRRLAKAIRLQSARDMDTALQNRLDPMYPGIRKALGHLDDGVPRDVRDVLIPFFVLYSDAFGAYRDGLLNDRDWAGFRQELAFWAQSPRARRAWAAFREQTWSDGFVEHVDAVLTGPPAYPGLTSATLSEPEIDWPDGPAHDEA